MTKDNPHWGTSLEPLLADNGIFGPNKAEAVTRVVAWELGEEIERHGITKAELAELMNTSRAQVDRILKAKRNITIETLKGRASGRPGNLAGIGVKFGRKLSHMRPRYGCPFPPKRGVNCQGEPDSLWFSGLRDARRYSGVTIDGTKWRLSAAGKSEGRRDRPCLRCRS